MIHASSGISRLEIAQRMGLSPASISALVGRLLAKGLIVESGQNATPLGRKPVSLAVSSDIAHLLGVDIGSFVTRVAITDFLGNVIVRAEAETGMDLGRQRVMDNTMAMMHAAIRDSRLPKGAIQGIGVAHSGVIDSENGMVLSFPRPGLMLEWKNLPLRRIFEEEFGLPTVLDDSTRLMAIAEKFFGLGVHLRDFFYVSVSRGIGAAIYMDGALYRGPGGFAGEFGHMTVDESGPLCCCGNYGCLEALASCRAILQSVRAAIAQSVDSKVRELSGGDLDRISIEMIADAAMENDTLAYRILNEAVAHIGVVLADVVNLLNPQVVIFGGPLFAKAAGLLFDPLMRVIRQRALEKSANQVQLQVSRLGSDAAARGATRLASERILESIYLQHR